MLYGKPPQRNYKNEIEFDPSIPVSQEAKSFMRASLHQDPKFRQEIMQLKE
jgi:hypothetical protein